MALISLPFGLSLGQIIPIVLLIMIIFAIFFRRYFSALLLDIGECIFSFIDEPFGGVMALDWGDWIFGIVIYAREKKISGKLIALIAAIEAANFIPVLDYVTNFIPTTTFLRFLFNKYRPAEAKEKKLEKEVSIAKEAGIEDIKAQEKALERIKDLIKQSDPVDALKESDKPIKEISSKLIEYTDSLIGDATNTIQYITSQNIRAPQELINILEQGIGQGTELLQQAKEAEEKEDFENAINSAVEAKNAVIESAQQFDYGMQQLNAQIEMQQTQQDMPDGRMTEEQRRRLEQWQRMQENQFAGARR